MTSGYNHRRCYIECDGRGCREFVEAVDEEPISALWNSARVAGWTGKKDGERWRHYCPGCSSEFGAPQAVSAKP